MKGDKIKSAEFDFWGDNHLHDYHILQESVVTVLKNNIDGIFCEVGIRRGFGTFILLDNITKNQVPKNVIGIDPYGNIPYKRKDSHEPQKSNYDNNLKNIFLKNVYEFAEKSNFFNYSFFNMTDEKFFKYFSDGVVFYSGRTESIINDYALVYLDGPHKTADVCNELDFFCPRTSKGGIIVIDDVNVMNKDVLDEKCKEYGFHIISSNHKSVAYEKFQNHTD